MEETYDTFQTASASNNRVNLPHSLQITKFTYARCKEIEIMRKSLAASGSGTKVAFQRLPKHMRRRAMSHNAKRLPRRLREIHLNQMKKSGLPPKQKRPSRKYRRKPNNILEDYARRQSKMNWLNTHIWHAKRYHMIEKWGYKLPYAPCDKSFTACFRATKSYCLLQDISYFKCIEISGKYDLIMDGLKSITNNINGLSITSRAFINGFRKGEITLYQNGTDLNKPIGLIEFVWKNNCDMKCKNTVILWLWIHAAFYEEALRTFIDCFNFNRESDKYSNKDETVKMNELKTELNRFRLVGYQSNKILHECFKICNSENILIERFKESYESAEEMVKDQHQYWDQINSVASTNLLSPHIVLPLIIHDPRLRLPKMQESSEALVSFNRVPTSDISIPASLLWNNDIRKMVNSSKCSNSDIAKLRNNLLVPSSNLSVLGDPVPIMLIQRPGSQKDLLGYSSGWDIILPSSWAQPIWISLIMSGARSGGLRDFQHNTFEMGRPDFLYPDTLGGEKEEQNITEKCMKTYFRKPPNKRTNYNKFKITSPFKFNWMLLIQNWLNRTVDNFEVIRDRKKLVDLQKCITLHQTNVSIPDNSLIPIQIECDKGVPKKFTIVCISKKEDLKKTAMEPKNIDSNQKERKLLREQHKKMLKRIRRKRKNNKKLDNQILSTDLEELSKYSSRMKELWLPETNNVRNSCSREVFGFIREGGFSYALGHAKGLGYIAGAAFNAFINSNVGDKVLFRNTNSRHYYVAKLSVITEL